MLTRVSGKSSGVSESLGCDYKVIIVIMAMLRNTQNVILTLKKWTRLLGHAKVSNQSNRVLKLLWNRVTSIFFFHHGTYIRW